MNTPPAPDSHWNPDQYLRFADHRLRPALELLGRVPLESPKLAVDLGCGTGNVTRLLADRWPEARVLGLDHSQEMLNKARAGASRAEDGGGGNAVEWQEVAIEEWAPGERPDLIYSNAALHWVEGHEELIPRLVGFLGDGGCLAVQMPLSWGAPSHRLARQTLADGGEDGGPLGSEELRRAVGRKWVEDAEVYYDLLRRRSSHLDVWETEYLQELEGEDPVLEWVRGTGLRPILDGLGDAERETFLSRYRARLRQAYPERSNGKTLYPFRRLFFVAVV